MTGYRRICLATGALAALCPAALASSDRFTRTEPATDQPVVHDSATDLVWQGCQSGRKGAGCTVNNGTSTMIWQDALSYCENLSWGNQTDWRLPNIKELVSIVDDRRWDPAIDVDAFPGTASDSFWSSSSYAGVIGNKYQVNFYDGWTTPNYYGTSYHVRCVRSGS